MKLSHKDVTLQLRDVTGFVSINFLNEPALFRKGDSSRALKNLLCHPESSKGSLITGYICSSEILRGLRKTVITSFAKPSVRFFG